MFNFLLLPFLCLLISGTTSSSSTASQPLRWDYGQYGIHNLIPNDHDTPSLDAVLTKECLLLRKRRSEQKVQMVQANFLVDLSEIGRTQENIRAGIRVLREAQPQLESSFETCPTCHFEYMQFQNVTYFDCITLCSIEHSSMVDNIDKMEEIYQLASQTHGLSFQKAWMRTDQDSSNKGQYLVDYKVQVADGNKHVSIFPVNTVNHLPVICYDHLDGKPSKISTCHSLGADIKYWNSRMGEESTTYYSRTHLKLLVRMVVSQDYLLYKEKGLINDTFSMKDFQRKHLYFEIVLPRSRVAHVQDNEKSTCFCHRPVSQIRVGISTANHHALVKLETSARTLTLGLEQERLRESGLPQLSNIEHLLESTLPSPRLSSLVNSEDIYPLKIGSPSVQGQLNRSEWDHMITGLGENNHLQDQVFNYTENGNSRSKRGLPGLVATAALSGLFKAGIAVGKPYFISQSKAVFGKLAENKEGFVITPSNQDTNQMSSSQLSTYLELNSNAAVRFEVQSDRLKVKFLDFPNIQIATNTNHSQVAFQNFDTAIARNEYFEAFILPSLPHLLMRRLWPLIHQYTTPDTSIFVQVQKSKSFVLLSYFYEKINHKSYVTRYSFFPLPCQKSNQDLYTINISNVTMEIGTELSRETSETQAYRCQSLFMTDKITSVGNDCQLEKTSAQPVTTGLEMKQGTLYLYDNCDRLYLACHNQPAVTLQLEFRFNVFFISRGCAISAHFTSGQTWNRVPLQHEGETFTYLHILNYNPAFMTSPLQKNRIVLGVLMAITITLLLGVAGVVMLLYWWRRRYAIQLSVQQTTSGTDPSSTNPQTIQPLSYLPNNRVDENVEVPPTTTDMQTATTISLSKAAVSVAAENLAEMVVCTECRGNSTFPGGCSSFSSSSFPHYRLPLTSIAEIQSSQTGRLEPKQHERRVSPLHVSRLSLDSAWSDSSGTESILKQVAEQLRPLRSPQLLHSLRQQSTLATSCPPPSQGHITQAHKPAQH